MFRYDMKGIGASMEYLILHHQEPIGRMRALEADRGMGVVVGPFVPFPAYEQVRPLFQRFAEVSSGGSTQSSQEQFERWYQERERLGLSIATPTGLPVETRWIHIVDYSADLGDAGYEAEFCVDYVDGTFFSNASLWSG